MLHGVFIILLFQLMGEVVQRLFALTIPGPVIGLILLLATLIFVKDRVPLLRKAEQNLSDTATFIVGLLSLFFVPAGVGVIAYVDYMGPNVVFVMPIIFLGTLSTIAVTALILDRFSKGGSNGA